MCSFYGALSGRPSPEDGNQQQDGGAADVLLLKVRKEGQMKVEYLRPDELVPYPGNAKQHPADQIKHIGWQQPIVCDKDKVVIIGHGRLLAAKELLLDSVPVVFAEDLTEDEANALRLADNKLNESPWDFSKLEEELAALDIAGIDMEQFGFADNELGISEPKEVSLEDKYQLIIDCDSEADMQEKYDALQEVGIECRVSTL